MSCPKCGGFMQYFKKEYMCRDCYYPTSLLKKEKRLHIMKFIPFKIGDN